MAQITFDDLLYKISDYYMTVHTPLKSSIDRATKLFKTNAIDRTEFERRVNEMREVHTNVPFLMNTVEICNLKCVCENIEITHFSENLDDNTVVKVKIKVLDDRVFIKAEDTDDRNG